MTQNEEVRSIYKLHDDSLPINQSRISHRRTNYRAVSSVSRLATKLQRLDVTFLPDFRPPPALSIILHTLIRPLYAFRHDYSSSSDTSRYLLDPHQLSTTYLSLTVTSMSAFMPSEEAPTPRVRLLISRFSFRWRCSCGCAPVFHGKTDADQCLTHAIAHIFGSLLKPYLLQCQRNGLELLHAGVKGFPSVDGFAHDGCLSALGSRHLRHDVSVEVRHSALVYRIWEHSGDGTDHSRGHIAYE